ncbi:glycoside hydrolase domain-containing protein [Nocardia rhizosphaerae]|uniref:Glycoside hydrolase domain-containing protein n=1 Tax=Nocardia rhizosphaerae TaxID=1691571 RepID=A0ABV8LDR8_9NOCA
MSTAVDFAARLIDPAAIVAAGHSAVLGYVSPSRPGANFGAKPITAEYARALTAAGLDIVSIWQYGKPGDPTPSDWTTGFAGGVRMAEQALTTHLRIGGPRYAPIFFAVDEDISLRQWNDTAVEFFRGVNSVLGTAWTGIYGHSRVCAWAIEDNVVGRRGEFSWVWQTRAWSGAERERRAVLYQRIIDTPADPGPLIDGTHVDVDDILAPDFGQWSLDRSAAVPPFTELDRLGAAHSSRDGARITNFVLHTQEGNGTAESLAAYLNNPANGVSYHYTVRDGIVVRVVDEHRAAWSVLSANPFTVNLCFAGSRAAWSREQWLAIDGDLRVAAFLAVRSAHRHGYATEVIAPPYRIGEGITDHHYVTQALGIGTHTDVGPNFPWDVFAAHVAGFAGHGVNAIDARAAAAPWLGARRTDGEAVTPDGQGRFAEFDHGYVYWHPATGAHAIPSPIMTKYAELGWEAGPLGYPTAEHTELPDARGTGPGQAQAFQGGTIYRRAGRPAHWVHGAIGARWAASGFEHGELGWPTSDEIAHDDGAYQEFEFGRIYWAPEQIVALRNSGDPDTPLARPA